MDKKGFELSVNMIIVFVLGFAILAVGLFIISKIGEVPIEFPQKCKTYPPTADTPICVQDSMDVLRGKTIQTTIAVYNNEDKDITSSVIPTVACSADIDGKSISIKTSAAGQTVKVGEVGQYKLILNIPKDAPRSTFPCSLKISQTEAQFAINIK